MDADKFNLPGCPRPHHWWSLVAWCGNELAGLGAFTPFIRSVLFGLFGDLSGAAGLVDGWCFFGLVMSGGRP